MRFGGNGKKGKGSRRFFIPENISATTVGYGPAVLKSICHGFGMPMDFEQQPNPCLDKLNGGFIDDLAAMAEQVGLASRQRLHPPSFLRELDNKDFPLLVPIRTVDGPDYFTVVWRRLGNRLQIMDPEVGRRWVTIAAFADEIQTSRHKITHQRWRQSVTQPENLAILKSMLRETGAKRNQIERWLQHAQSDRDWQGFARLHDAARLITDFMTRKAIKKGHQAIEVLNHLLVADEKPIPLPDLCQTVRAASHEDELMIHAVPVLHLQPALSQAQKSSPDPNQSGQPLATDATLQQTQALFGKTLRESGWLMVGLIVLALSVEALLRIFETLVFRSLMDMGALLDPWQRAIAMGLFVLVLIAGIFFFRSINLGLYRFGRHFEAKLRTAYLTKIPKLDPQRLDSESLADLADRCHHIHTTRDGGYWFGRFFRATSALITILTAIIWIDPGAWLLALAATILVIWLPIAARGILGESAMRKNAQAGRLSRYYLDALQGLIPCRTHAAEKSIRNAHEGMLVHWLKAAFSMEIWSVLFWGLQYNLGAILGVFLVLGYYQRGGDASGMLLLFYWALRIPVSGIWTTLSITHLSEYKTRVLRLATPLSWPEESDPDGSTTPVAQPKEAGAALTLSDVHIQISGQPVLHSLTLEVAPGERIAIVGPSGSGKSTLTGLFLGWHKPHRGQILVDGQTLTHHVLEKFRSDTCWVDPAVRLWNRSLFENLHYGASASAPPKGDIIGMADLQSVFDKLPDGMQTTLGENGGFLSGGEGQRVRLGRGMQRPNARLVILDEPFRGLDRAKRRHLLKNVHQWWPRATFLFVTHDLSDTLGFDRVLVMENGTIVEDGVPTQLATQNDTRFYTLLEAEHRLRQQQWANPVWRKLVMEEGRIREQIHDPS